MFAIDVVFFAPKLVSNDRTRYQVCGSKTNALRDFPRAETKWKSKERACKQFAPALLLFSLWNCLALASNCSTLNPFCDADCLLQQFCPKTRVCAQAACQAPLFVTTCGGGAPGGCVSTGARFGGKGVRGGSQGSCATVRFCCCGVSVGTVVLRGRVEVGVNLVLRDDWG